MDNTERNDVIDEIKGEIRKMRHASVLKDVFVAIIPLLAALATIFYSARNFEKQLGHNREALQSSNRIESAKLIKEFSTVLLDPKLESPDAAELADIAFSQVDIDSTQRDRLSAIIEKHKGGSDAPSSEQIPPTRPEEDKKLAELLNQLFSPTKSTRMDAFPRVHNYIETNPKKEVFTQLVDKIKDNPLNIKGRSNILAIISRLETDILRPHTELIETELKRIEGLKSQGVIYAVGPQTEGWIAEIRKKLA